MDQSVDSNLMNARLVGKRVSPNYSLIGLHPKTYDRREQLTCRIQLGRIDIVFVRHLVGTDGHCHDQLFERGVSGSLAYAIDGAFHLRCTGFNGRQAVGDRQA